MAIVDASLRGWSTEDLQFVPVHSLDGAREAFSADEADAFFWEKYTSNPFVESGEFRRIGERETPWPAFVVCVRKDCLDQYRQPVKRVLEIVNSVCDRLMHSDRASELISQRYGIQQGVVEEWFGLTRWDTGFESPLDQIQTVRNYLEQLGLAPMYDIPTRDLWFKL